VWAGRIPGAGSGLAAADALSSLAVAYMNRRMVDELNIEVTGDILDHAQILDLAFFEDPLRQDLIARTQSNTAVHLQTFVAESLAAVRNLLSAASLLAVLVLIDPLVLVVVPPFAIPFLYFQAKLARQRFTEEHQRAEKRRWTSYFVSKLTSSDSVAEVRLLGLGPLLAQRSGRCCVSSGTGNCTCAISGARPWPRCSRSRPSMRSSSASRFAA
jgi:ABC-type bacteriocin/lantibiotic exporter with double-glycine peptidase domain